MLIRPILERLRLCDYFYERYFVQHGKRATGMRDRRRHVGQRVKLLQNAYYTDHNMRIRPVLERLFVRNIDDADNATVHFVR
ncbi:MAG: hypothetical protein AAB835_01770 [Patescibacteria group bacterium]